MFFLSFFSANKYLLDQTEVFYKLSLSLSQLIDHLQRRKRCTSNFRHVSGNKDNFHTMLHGR